jgi:hypothetical protein
VVRVARFRNGIAVFALAGGLAAAGGLPALAAPAVPPTVTIAAKSFFPPVTGDVFVLFHAPARFSRAQIHGTISGASSGEVARLFARTFPFRHAPVRVGAVTLTRATSAYSFTVTPSLATRYQVEVFANGTSTMPLASSAVRIVFVSNLMVPSGFSFGSCSRPVCRQKIRVVEFVPPSTLRTEISKRWFFYFGLSLSPTPPRFLTLDTHATISRPVRVSSGSFAVTITWSFRIGNSGFTPAVNFCNKDTESTDGLGLPGHHSCGASRISATIEYLG